MARSRKSKMIDDVRRPRRDRAPAGAGAKESLREAEQRFRTVFDSTSDGIFLHDPETGKITMCNKSCSQMLGYTEEEFAQLHVDDIHPEADLLLIRAQIEELLKGGKPTRRDIRFKRKDGSVLFADVSPDVVLLDGRRHMLVVLKEVTERTRAEELLAESERKYRSLVENIPDVTWTTDRQGRTLFISPNVLDVYGYSAEEICTGNGTWLENVHPDDRARIERAFDELFTENKRYDVEYRIRRKDGTWIWLHDRSVSSYEKDGQWYADGVFSDLTERKRMEEELRRYTEHLEELVAARTRELQESEAGLAAAQRLAHLGSWQWDIGADTASWSEETFRIFGVARKPLEQHREDFLSRIVPEDRRRVDQALADALAGARDYDLEYRITLPDGRERVIHAQAQVLRSSDGRPVMMHGTVQDITEHKLAEEALRTSEERFRTMADQAPIMIGVTNEKGEITFLNQAWLDFRGKTLEDEAGWNWAAEMHPEDRDRVVSAMQSAINRGDRYSLEYRIRDHLGNYRWVLDTAAPLLGPRGESRGYIGTALDITERRRAEEALAESRKRYRGLVEKINDWVWEVDADGVYTYASPRALELLGYGPEEIVGKTPFDLMPSAEAQRVWNAFGPIWLERKPLELLENTLVRKDGSLVTVETSGMPLFAEDGSFQGYTGIDRDVTSRKRAEEVLREKEYLLSESQRIGHIGSWSADPVTNLATWTPEMYRLFGVSPDTFVPSADAFIELLHPDDRDAMREWIRAASAGEHPGGLELRVPLADGSVRVLIGRGEAIFADDHRPVRLVGTAQDVTEQKQAQEALWESEQRLKRAQEIAHLGSWELDLTNDRLSWSDEVYRLFGVQPQEFGASYEAFLSYVHPDDRDVVDAAYFGSLREGKDAYEIEHRIVRKSTGEIRVVHEKCEHIRDASGRIIRSIGMVHDITDRKRMEESLQFTQFAVDHTADAAFWMTEDGRFFYVNEAACRALGYSREELLTMTVYDIDPAFTQSIWSESWRKLKAEKSIVLETVHRTRDGMTYPVEIRANYLEFGGRAYDCAFARDITARKQAEEALRESEKRYRTLFETAGDAILLMQEDRFIDCNSRAIEMFGAGTQDQIVGHAPYELSPPQQPGGRASRDLASEKITTGLSGAPQFFEWMHARCDGTLFPAEVSLNRVELGGRVLLQAIVRDITERKRAQAALEESEQRYRRLVENLKGSHFIYRHDTTGVLTYVSESVTQVLGYTPDEGMPHYGKYFTDHPVNQAAHRHTELTFQGIPQPPYEVNVWHKDGSTRWLEVQEVPVYEDGKVVAVEGVAQDITERKRAEEALLESEERYRILLEHGFDGIFVHEDFRIVQLNDRLVEMTGYTREELMGSKAIDMFRPKSQEHIRRYVRSGATGYFEIELRRRDGQVVDVESYGASCRFQGRNARIVGLRDITERKRAEEALRESEERFRTAFEEGAVAMTLTALDSTLLKVNSSFCRMLGFSESELVGRSFTEITHPDDRAAHLVGTRRLACGEISSFRMEKRYIRKDGGVIWADMSTASVRDANGRPLYCVTHVQDITDRKQAEEALRSLNEQLELQVAQRTEALRHTVDRLRQLTLDLSQAEDRERKRIADILHEDVQQTLAAARFHLNLLAGGIYSAEESQAIIGQIRQMLRDAIERSRNLSHELSPAIYQVELTEILEWLARQMREKHGLTVRMEAHGQVDSRSEALKALLFKVVQELLFNVVKHAGVREARVRVRRMRQSIYLSVADHGRGFNPEELDGVAGFGLLSIRERVGLLGGRMKIRSVPGRGSRILIGVPDQGDATA